MSGAVSAGVVLVSTSRSPSGAKHLTKLQEAAEEKKNKRIDLV
uniref:GTP-binding protein Sar1 n=1 Tax=Rhizophora mucronata TaxID=61149 RepID=A0A2P2J8E7_RHIMU